MLSLILAAALAQAPPADEWRPYTANPAYEVYGHMDSGVFCYTKSRPKAAPKKAEPAKNFGVIVGREKLIESSVRGTDNELARTLAEVEHRAQQARKAEAKKAEAPCPGPGPCPAPDRTPRPDLPRPHVPQPLPPTIERDALIVVGVVALVAIAGFAVLVLVVATIFVALRALWRHLASPAHDVV